MLGEAGCYAERPPTGVRGARMLRQQRIAAVPRHPEHRSRCAGTNDLLAPTILMRLERARPRYPLIDTLTAVTRAPRRAFWARWYGHIIKRPSARSCSGPR